MLADNLILNLTPTFKFGRICVKSILSKYPYGLRKQAVMLPFISQVNNTAY